MNCLHWIGNGRNDILFIYGKLKEKPSSKQITVIYWHEFQLKFKLLKWVNWIRSLNHCYRGLFCSFFSLSQFEYDRFCTCVSLCVFSHRSCIAIFLLVHAVALCDNEFAFHIYTQPIHGILHIHAFAIHHAIDSDCSSCDIHFWLRHANCCYTKYRFLIQKSTYIRVSWLSTLKPNTLQCAWVLEICLI